MQLERVPYPMSRLLVEKSHRSQQSGHHAYSSFAVGLGICPQSVPLSTSYRFATYRLPIWFNTSRSAPTRFANSPAIAGVECPLASTFSRTTSSFLRACGSTELGIHASVASCIKSEGEGDLRRGSIAEASHVSPRIASFRLGKRGSLMMYPMHGSKFNTK